MPSPLQTSNVHAYRNPVPYSTTECGQLVSAGPIMQMPDALPEFSTGSEWSGIPTSLALEMPVPGIVSGIFAGPTYRHYSGPPTAVPGTACYTWNRMLHSTPRRAPDLSTNELTLLSGSSTCWEQWRSTRRRSGWRTVGGMGARRQASRRRTWWGAAWGESALHWTAEHLTVRPPRPAEHMWRHVRPPLHRVESSWRLSHHSWVESRWAHRVEPHTRRRSSMKHHPVHLRLPLELGRHHSLPSPSRVLPRCYDVSCWYLLGCRGTITGVGFTGASLLRSPLSESFLRDTIYTVNLEVHALSAFLRVRHPGTRSHISFNGLEAYLIAGGKQLADAVSFERGVRI